MRLFRRFGVANTFFSLAKKTVCNIPKTCLFASSVFGETVQSCFKENVEVASLVTRLPMKCLRKLAS
jgi:hypothetical protein